MQSLIFIIASVFLFNNLQFGDTLQCYHCDMEKGKDCDNPKGNTVLIANCSTEREETVCYTRTVTENGISKILRGCGKTNPCISGTTIPTPNDNSTCTKCDTDLCNFETKGGGLSNFHVNFLGVFLSIITYVCMQTLF